MEQLSKEERGLLYRLVSKGVEATLAELDDDYLEQDVLAKHELVQHFIGLEKKGLILGTSQDGHDWYVDMWGMLNLCTPELTPAGRDYLVKEQQMSCVEFYAPGKGPGSEVSAPAGAGAYPPPQAGVSVGAGAGAKPEKTGPEPPSAAANLPELKALLLGRTGAERPELLELLLELEEMIENLSETRHIVKNSGFIRRLEKQRERHAWFYQAVLALLGRTVLELAGGKKQNRI